MSPEKKRADNDDDNGRQEHKDGDPVDPMHVFYPPFTRRVGIPLPDIKVFRYLPPYAHEMDIYTLCKVHPAQMGRQMFFSAISPIFAVPNGGLAQLARAFAWHAKGHRFDSGNLHKKPDQWSGFFMMEPLFG
jgi:hypothetical protein